MKSEWDEYAKGWDVNPSVIEYSKKAFQSLLEVTGIEGLNILDFGCGTGLLSEQMSARAKSIVALDSSVEMALVLKNKKLPNLKVIDEVLTQRLIESNSLLSDKFDLIVASSVCGFLPDYQQTLQLLKSLLVQNGLFVQWDWLAEKEGSGTGLTKNEIESAFDSCQMSLLQCKIPFNMVHDDIEMPVLMAVGKNVVE